MFGKGEMEIGPPMLRSHIRENVSMPAPDKSQLLFYAF